MQLPVMSRKTFPKVIHHLCLESLCPLFCEDPPEALGEVGMYALVKAGHSVHSLSFCMLTGCGSLLQEASLVRIER